MSIMKLSAQACLVAVSLTAALAMPAFAQTPDAPAPPPPPPAAPLAHHGGRYEGTVTAVNASGFTITTRRDNQTITVVTEPKTKFTQIDATPISSLKTGDAIVVHGMMDETAGTVNAAAIHASEPAMDNHKGEAPKNEVTGTVASTSPTLTITDASSKTWTVTTRPNAVLLTRSDVTAATVAVGSMVRVTGPAEADSTGTFSAKRVEIMTGVMSANVAPNAHRHRGAGAEPAPVAP